MSISKTQFLKTAVPESPIYTSDSREQVKRSFTDLQDSTESCSRSIGNKKMKRAPALPNFTTDLTPTAKTQAIAARLLPLFRDPDPEVNSRLQATIDYIETYKDKLVQISQSETHKTLYIHPDQTLSPRPFHIQICCSEEGASTIYILPKLHFLGKGSTKRVRKAIDYTHEINVACATIRLNDSNLLNKTLHEFAMQKLFGQANDLSIYFKTYSPGKMLIFMPYGDFGSLENAVYPEGHVQFFKEFNAGQRQEIFHQIIRLVAEFHADGYVISDIKPGNIVIRREKGKPIVMLPDLGTAYLEKDREASRYVGTPEYMGPEYLENSGDEEQIANIGRPTDIFALGRTLWELFLGGLPPWMVNVPLKALWMEPQAYRRAYLATPSFIEGSLENLIFRMTHPDPQKRPTIEKLFKEPPALTISSPSYQGVRLLSSEESLSRHENNRKRVYRSFPEESCYTLMQAEKPDHFFLHIQEALIKAKPLENGQIRIYKTPKRYRTYASLESYLEKQGLCHCLNWDV